MIRVRTLLLVAASLLPADAAGKPLNVVLIMADDVGYECFTPYGSRQYSTPALDKLADTGVRFTHCYSTPLCTPSRVALMTGKSNVRNYADFGALLSGEYTFVDLFRQAGYATAVAGKWQLQGGRQVAGVLPAEAGFDAYCLWNTPITERRRYWNPSIDLNGTIKPVAEDDYGPDIFAGFLLDFIEQNRDRPFFVYYPMALPHSPFLPTPDSSNRNSKDSQNNFEDMVAYTDKLVGRFATELDRLNLHGNTVLIFTADNGSHHNLRSQLGGRTIRGDKGAATDAGTHVPLIVRAPGIVPGGRVTDDLIHFADFLPTLTDAIGARLPDDLAIDGRSFWPQLLGQRGNPRDSHFTYYFPRPYAEEFKTPYQHPEIRYARDQRYKLYGDGRLFDLAADPTEKSPLDGFRAVRRKLEAVLDSMPAHGRRIPEEQWQRSRGVPIPAW
jgi:arylsulfatase A